MKDREKRAKASSRDKAAEREAERRKADALAERMATEPGWRLDRLGRPFKIGS